MSPGIVPGASGTGTAAGGTDFATATPGIDAMRRDTRAHRVGTPETAAGFVAPAAAAHSGTPETAVDSIALEAAIDSGTPEAEVNSRTLEAAVNSRTLEAAAHWGTAEAAISSAEPKTTVDSGQPDAPRGTSPGPLAAAPPATKGGLPAVLELIDGEWGAPGVDLDVALEDPATGDEVGRTLGSAPHRVERALAVAQGAAASAGSITPETLDAIADALEPRLGRIAELDSWATGVPIRQTTPLGAIVAGSFRLAAQQVRAGALRADRDGVRVLRLPLGPALCLVPWNAPAPMAAHKVANALAAGCPVILKVSELAPYSAIPLAEAVAEHVPPGMFQLVHGGAQTGAQLVADPRIAAVSFTGGLAGGRSVAVASAPLLRPCQLELGGNNPLVVLPDADPDIAARMAAELLTTLNGQWCRALGRLILPAGKSAEILAATGERLAALRIGPPLDPDTEFGPLVHSRHLAALRNALPPGSFRSFGTLPKEGNYFAPTLLDGDLAEEAFGPVAGVVTYDTVEEAVRLANAVPYGLEGYVCGADETAALAVAQQIRAGEVKVNGSSVMSLHLMTPRPAWGLSGLGEEGTAETLRFFTGARVVGVEGRFALHTS